MLSLSAHAVPVGWLLSGAWLQHTARHFKPPLQPPCFRCCLQQVLEVTEQLLRQSDLLSDFSHQQMPADSLAGIFLSNLGDVLAQQPELGSVIR